MLLGAGLSRAWPHDRAHYFFARARWEIDELGLAVARLAVLLVPVGAPLTVAVDDSLFRRAGGKVYGAGSQYDGSSPAQDKLSFGTCFVVAGIVVHLPFLARPVCLPVLGRLVPHGGKTGRAAEGGTKTTAGRKKDSAPGSKTAAAVALITLLAAAFPDRPVHVVATRSPRPGAEAAARHRDLDHPAARQRRAVRPGTSPPRAATAVSKILILAFAVATGDTRR